MARRSAPPASAPVERLVYSVAEAAAALGIDADTAYLLIADGHLPARRLRPGGHLRVLASDLAAYLAGLPTEVAAPEPPSETAVAPTPEPSPAPKRDRRRVVRLLDPFAAVDADADCEVGL